MRDVPLGQSMKLIVGLGNPGAEYEWTPHNLGFLAVDGLARREGIRVTRPESKSYVGRGKMAGQEVVLAKPQTMMNLSGIAVRELLERYQGTPADLILLLDEVDLPWGMLRIRERGAGSTHNGFQSVVSSLGTDEFVRIRLGCQPDYPVGDRADYVLKPMRKPEREVGAQMVADAAEAVDLVLTEGVDKAMTRFNRRVSSTEEESQ
jgi:PTH1 family peptidyl-tRNA hydrolase